MFYDFVRAMHKFMTWAYGIFSWLLLSAGDMDKGDMQWVYKVTHFNKGRHDSEHLSSSLTFPFTSCLFCKKAWSFCSQRSTIERNPLGSLFFVCMTLSLTMLTVKIFETCLLNWYAFIQAWFRVECTTVYIWMYCTSLSCSAHVQLDFPFVVLSFRSFDRHNFPSSIVPEKDLAKC